MTENKGSDGHNQTIEVGRLLGDTEVEAVRGKPGLFELILSEMGVEIPRPKSEIDTSDPFAKFLNQEDEESERNPLGGDTELPHRDRDRLDLGTLINIADPENQKYKNRYKELFDVYLETIGKDGAEASEDQINVLVELYRYWHKASEEFIFIDNDSDLDDSTSDQTGIIKMSDHIMDNFLLPLSEKFRALRGEELAGDIRSGYQELVGGEDLDKDDHEVIESITEYIIDGTIEGLNMIATRNHTEQPAFTRQYSKMTSFLRRYFSEAYHNPEQGMSKSTAKLTMAKPGFHNLLSRWLVKNNPNRD